MSHFAISEHLPQLAYPCGNVVHCYVGERAALRVNAVINAVTLGGGQIHDQPPLVLRSPLWDNPEPADYQGPGW